MLECYIFNQFGFSCTIAPIGFSYFLSSDGQPFPFAHAIFSCLAPSDARQA